LDLSDVSRRQFSQVFSFVNTTVELFTPLTYDAILLGNFMLLAAMHMVLLLFYGHNVPLQLRLAQLTNLEIPPVVLRRNIN